jgi:uncharacterized protein DUF6599
MTSHSSVRGFWIISLCVALLGAACHRRADTTASPFPASTEVEGWARTGEVRTFAAADLWKYIDGEAERYLRADVKTASTADYRFRNEFDAVVDIYTMESLAGVEKILESEPAAGVKAVQLGDNGRLYGQSLVFRKGPDLVRITAYEESAETQSALLALGRGIEQRLTK